MDRNSIYVCKDGEPSTFEFDESLPPLPLPKLSQTLNRYYETLKPFGTQQELQNTQKLIAEFSKGIGSKLQEKLENRASKMKNWLDVWWDTYAYHTLRFPLHPYMSMSMALKLGPVGVEESKSNCLKANARLIHHTLEYAYLIHTERMKPSSSGGGKIKYCSALLKRFVSTSRIPGETVDKVVTHFKTVREGATPTHGCLFGKGRIFLFDCVNKNGTILSPQQILVILEQVNGILECEGEGDCVPVLTQDERTSWAHNRQKLMEISPTNKNYLDLIESSLFVGVLDDHEPKDYEEAAQEAVTGDFHSKWADRSSISICYKNGKFALIGEHSAYDGTISMHFSLFVQLSMIESGEPDWSIAPEYIPTVKEIKFGLDEGLLNEIQRVKNDCEGRRNDVILSELVFDTFGKEYIKSLKLHPDSFIQIIIQWTYYLLHGEIAPIYETALMRQYYNGRTETLRSCTMEVVDFIKVATNPLSSKQSIVDALRKAVNHHTHMMNEAREGKGVDRHLFGLWCVAQEEGIELPQLYTDPLYTKSGGGGNFILSTSTLGYSLNNGNVAPMVMDGYGIFYSITSDAIQIYTTAFRASQKTSSRKFNTKFSEMMREAKVICDAVAPSKL